MAGLYKRGKVYYAVYRVGRREKRVSLGTTSLQIAKEKKRKIESRLAHGEINPLPTKTPVEEIVTAYVDHIRTVKRPKSAQTDLYYLREAFGPICPALQVTSRRVSEKARKRRLKPGTDRRCKVPTIEANCFEQITTAQISEFISSIVRSRGLAPKTANRYREILTRLFNWSMKERGLRLASGKNPAAAVERYKERAPNISFLTLDQIDEQLRALAFHPLLRTLVATYIYAGLRREEALWLQRRDIDLRAGTYGMIRIRPKDVDGLSWEPKTKKNRAVPISSSLRAYLDRYTPVSSHGDWYFPSPQGRRYDPDNFSRDLRAVQKAHHLSWSCLDFRHTFGSQLAMKGESLYKISTLMGNSPEICRRHYAALIPESLSNTVEFEANRRRLSQTPEIAG